MNVSRFKAVLFSALLLTSLEVSANISPAGSSSTAQMVSLNLQIKSKNQIVKSDLNMPFYQKGEMERKFGDKNVLIEFNPRRGKNPDEIALEMKFYNASSSKAFFKKEIIAKVNQESRVTFRGMSLKVTPVLN